MPSARITDGRLIRAATGSAACPKGRTQPLRGRLQTVAVSVTTDRRSQVLARPKRCPLASWPHQADGLASAAANINALELALPTHPAVQVSIELQSALAGIRWAHTVCRAHSSATRDLQCGARTGAGASGGAAGQSSTPVIPSTPCRAQPAGRCKLEARLRALHFPSVSQNGLAEGQLQVVPDGSQLLTGHRSCRGASNCRQLRLLFLAIHPWIPHQLSLSGK